MSYQGESADKDKVVNALGGKKGLIDSGLPSLVFLIVFNLSDKNINTAIYAALTLSIVLTFLRLIKRETLQHAFSGLVGVGICALISRRSGNAADFYLPGLWINAGYALLYTITNLVKWPILGVLLGPILGENMMWRLSTISTFMSGWTLGSAPSSTGGAPGAGRRRHRTPSPAGSAR